MTTSRVLATSVGLGLLMLSGAGIAAAAPSTVDLNAASATAGAADLGTYFVHLDQHQAKQSIHSDSTAAQAKAPKLVGAAQAVYTLNPAFVSGAAPGTIAEFAHAAVEATSASGQHASVWLARNGQGWEVQNISSNTDDVAFTSQAAGDIVFTEPQINAWYRVHGDQVSPLNAPARASVGTGTTVAAYQKLVHDKYADKMAGSEYARNGMMGGFRPGAAEDGVQLGVIVPAGTVVLAGVAFAAFALRRRSASVQRDRARTEGYAS